MLPKLKNAFVELYSIETLISSDGKDDFNKDNAFFGRINEAGFSTPISERL
ncbi:hypothetical protein D3C87_1836540 [compost metagenome]